MEDSIQPGDALSEHLLRGLHATTVLGLDRVLYFEPDYTSISRVLVSRAGTRSIRSLNETAHLPSPD